MNFNPFVCMKLKCLYCCLSFMMIGLAMLRLTNMAPWVDEVMFIDTPMHFINGKGWTTYAWYSVAKQTPFLLYPPLYSMMMVLWMKAFGTTLIACRSLNLIVTMLIGVGLLRICRQLGLKMSLIQIGILVVLLWCTDDMMYMYANGRPDLLGAAILIYAISEMICLNHKKKGWSLILLTALLFMSGIQSAVYLYILLLLAYLTLKDYRDVIKRITAFSAFGTFLGFLLVCAFMAYHDHLIAFVVNMLSYSNTLMNLAMIILPILADSFGIDVTLYIEKIANNTTDVPFYSRILTIYTHPAYVTLLVVALFVFLSEYRSIKVSSLYVMMRLLFVIVLSIPFLMNLAGRFPDYYYWMVYIPLFLLVVIMAGITNKHRCIIIGLISMSLSIKGLVFTSLQNNYSMVETILSKCTMLRDKNIVAPFSVFYDMEKLGCNTYYLGVYPSHYLPNDIEYVILPQKDSDYGANRLYDYCDSINESDSLQTVMVATNKIVGLKVVKVIKKLQNSDDNS